MEKEDKLFYDYYSLSDTLFDAKVDSLIEEKQQLLTAFKLENSDISPLFEKYANAIIKISTVYKKRGVSISS